jgi:uncharacterized membrane protein
MDKWCPQCHRNITDPGTSEMTKYAKFWRDNRCYFCGSLLVNASEELVLHKEYSESQNTPPPYLKNTNKINRKNCQSINTSKKYIVEFTPHAISDWEEIPVFGLGLVKSAMRKSRQFYMPNVCPCCGRNFNNSTRGEEFLLENVPGYSAESTHYSLCTQCSEHVRMDKRYDNLVAGFQGLIFLGSFLSFISILLFYEIFSGTILKGLSTLNMILIISAIITVLLLIFLFVFKLRKISKIQQQKALNARISSCATMGSKIIRIANPSISSPEETIAFLCLNRDFAYALANVNKGTVKES